MAPKTKPEEKEKVVKARRSKKPDSGKSII
jgi:hypothetical protein